MGANRAGDNKRKKRKRQLKNLLTTLAAREKGDKPAAKKPAAKKPAKKAAPKKAAK